jgi:membrane protein DedA with SNARE-associated domain
MFEPILETVEEFLISYSFWGVFFAFFIAQVFPPIPSPFVIMSVGFFVLGGGPADSFIETLVLKVSLPAALGDTIGSFLVYALSFFIGKPFIERWGKFFSLSWETIEKIQARLKKSYYDELALLGLRALPIFPSFPVTVTCGLIRFNFKSFAIFTFLGTFVKVLMLAPLGWQAGQLYHKYAGVISSLEWVGLAIIVIAVIFFIVKKRSSDNVKIRENHGSGSSNL